MDMKEAKKDNYLGDIVNEIGKINATVEKLDREGPVDNRPSTN